MTNNSYKFNNSQIEARSHSFRHELYKAYYLLHDRCIIFHCLHQKFSLCSNVYIFAAEKEKEVSKLKAQIQLEESWYVTPPPCFEASGLSPEVLEPSPMEDLLIEHPSMSVYGPGVRRQSPSVSSASRSSSVPRSEEAAEVERREPRRTVQFQAQLDVIERRRQTEPPLQASIRPNRKNLKKQNMVHFQNNSRSKRNKKRDRMLGKHIGVHGKRGC